MRIKLSFPLKLSDITSALDVPSPMTDNLISYISTDTRELFPGDLFIALHGKKFNGSDFTDEAISKGAVAISESECATIRVNDANYALIKMISLFKSKLKHLRYTIAITGSVGKTTTKELLRSILATKYNVHATDKNNNNIFGIFNTVLSAPSDTEILILECGMNAKGELYDISRAITPTHAIITNVGHAHIGMLGSRKEIASAKLEIAEHLVGGGSLYLSDDEPLFSSVSNANRFSLTDLTAHFCICTKNLNEYGSIFDAFSYGKHLYSAFVPLLGEHILMCLCPTLAVANDLCVELETIRSTLHAIPSSILRQRLLNANGYTVYDDTYSSSPEAIKATMKMLSLLGKTISPVLGDMLELGEYSRELHRAIGKDICKHNVRYLYAIGRFAQDIAEGALSYGMSADRIHVNLDPLRLDITADAIKKNYSGEIILLKASHAIHLEEIIPHLMKGNENA